MGPLRGNGIGTPDSGGSFETRPAKKPNRIWSSFLAFLEIIGLRRVSHVDSVAVVTRLRHHHAEFRQLLTSNDSFLNALASLNNRFREGEIEPISNACSATARACAS